MISVTMQTKRAREHVASTPLLEDDTRPHSAPPLCRRSACSTNDLIEDLKEADHARKRPCLIRSMATAEETVMLQHAELIGLELSRMKVCTNAGHRWHVEHEGS